MFDSIFIAPLFHCRPSAERKLLLAQIPRYPFQLVFDVMHCKSGDVFLILRHRKKLSNCNCCPPAKKVADFVLRILFWPQISGFDTIKILKKETL